MHGGHFFGLFFTGQGGGGHGPLAPPGSATGLKFHLVREGGDLGVPQLESAEPGEADEGVGLEDEVGLWLREIRSR